ncbi:MAG: helix-turn-helix transcriptional regulator [Oscillospiraceae bacterium]|nr:helix-turn-helix transcriptional regulator [Oscillospiraceae bacterium]
MARGFSDTMSALRRQRGLSQRAAAAALGISQALLSHYENGAREPGLAFVCRACDYYGVTADYLLGRADDRAESVAADALRGLAQELRALADRAENAAGGEDRA